MGKRHGGSLGPYYWFAVSVIKPFMNIATTNKRTNLEILSDDYPPTDGIIVAINHMSWFDPMNVCILLWDAGRPPRFLAKDKLFTVPGFGRIMSNAGQIPVYRESSDAANAIRDAVAAIEAGEAVVVYPEGTMTRDENYWPMTGRTGAAHLSLLTGQPVIPIAQWGPQEVVGAYKKEFNIFPRKKMVSNIGEPVDLDDLRGKKITEVLLHEATTRITTAITTLLEEIRGEKAPPQRLDFRDWKAKHAKDKASDVKSSKGDS